MKKTMALIVVLCAAVLVAKVGYTAGDSGASVGNVKIGVVDLGRALNEVNEWKKS